MAETIHVTVPLSKMTHKKLKALAGNRDIPLQKFCQIMLDWGGEQNIETLIELGLRLPVYGGEFTTSRSTKE